MKNEEKVSISDILKIYMDAYKEDDDKIKYDLINEANDIVFLYDEEFNDESRKLMNENDILKEILHEDLAYALEFYRPNGIEEDSSSTINTKEADDIILNNLKQLIEILPESNVPKKIENCLDES